MSKHPSAGSVLITILNFNGWQESLVCIESVLKQTYSNFHILLIDNGSADESLVKLKKYEKHPNITFVKNPVNLGFAGGVNMGINHAIDHNYPYVVLLNNDASLTPSWLQTLVDTSMKKGSSITTGLLLDSGKEKIESTADAYSSWGLPFPAQRGEPVEKAMDSGYVFGGTAGASLYTTSLFKEIGLFDDTFFAYFEDTDISFRSQLSGHTAWYEKTAVAYHDHGTTSGKMPGFTVKQTFKNLPIFFWKNTPFALLFPTGIKFFTYYVLIYIRAIARGQFIPATKGVIKSLLLLSHAFKERRRIQKNKTVTTAYIRSLTHKGLPPANKRYIRRFFR